MKISTYSLATWWLVATLSGVQYTSGAPSSLKGAALDGAKDADSEAARLAHSWSDGGTRKLKSKKSESNKSKKGGGDSADGAASGVFSPAQPLSFFRDGMDPEVFEWINKDEIQAGNTTCGFLYPPLGCDSTKTFPKIKVYFCMKFATIQPAPKGNIFVHCGGPSTLTDCIDHDNGMGNELTLGEDSLNQYNLISVDQRGLGRSWPSWAHEACVTGATRDEKGKLVVYDEDAAGHRNGVNTDPSDPEDIRRFLQAWKIRVSNCWTCEDCDFQLSAEQADGTTNTYHFLEYSGTRQLAEDLDRFRKAIKADKLNLLGVSYGTAVMSTYATIFPESVGLFVIDSNMPPTSSLLDFATSYGQGVDARIDYMIYACTAQNVLTPGSCPVDDLSSCLTDFQALHQGKSFKDAKVNTAAFIELMFQNWDRAGELCQAAADGDEDKIESIFNEYELSKAPDVNNSTRRAESTGLDQYSQPTTVNFVATNPDYKALMDKGYISNWLVIAQDLYGGSLDDNKFIKKVIKFNEEYPGAGTGAPAQSFMYWYSFGFYWPKGVPLAPRGNPFQEGIVSGMLYDSATPYVWTQQMRAEFKSTKLLTSQSFKHGLADDSINPECQRHIIRYFETGEVGIVDGTVCGEPFASITDLGKVFEKNFTGIGQ